MDIYAVSQVITHLRELLESNPALADIWISGEVSNLSRPSSGHLYFTLKDERAALRCVLFRSAPGAREAQTLESGHQVVAHGRISIYEPRGELQMIVDFVRPEGMGALQLEFERLKAQLESEGLFDDARKRPLPQFPRRIGVVTSPSGAVFHDICHVLGRRWPLAEVVLAPSPVQGPEAVAGVIEGLRRLNELGDVDVIIVARGGGSLEELAAFNAEPVARAIYASQTPVVSAVGHETDYTIADFVADLRAPTPSAAAEMVGPDQRQLRVQIGVQAANLDSVVRNRLQGDRRRVESLVSAVERREPDFPRLRQLVDDRARAVANLLDGTMTQVRTGLGAHLWRLRSLDPLATLERGYAIVQRDGDVVSSVRTVRAGEPLGVRLRDGSFGVRVEGAPSARRPRRKAADPCLQPPLFAVPEVDLS